MVNLMRQFGLETKKKKKVKMKYGENPFTLKQSSELFNPIISSF